MQDSRYIKMNRNTGSKPGYGTHLHLGYSVGFVLTLLGILGGVQKKEVKKGEIMTISL